MQSKSTLRKLALSKRNTLPEEERAEKSQIICKKLASFINFTSSHPERAKRVEGPHEIGGAKLKNCEPNNSNLTISSSTQSNRGPSNEVLRLHSNTPCSHSAQDDEPESLQLFTNSYQEFRASSTIALYEAINSEVNLSELALTLTNSGAKIFKPIMSEVEGVMEFTDWENTFDPRETFDLQSWQPSLTLVKPEEIDIIVCPIVAFDSECNRLGYGGGYYDRYLPRMSSSSLKIGVAFACQQVEEIPRDPHDIPLEYIITEQPIYGCHDLLIS